MKTTNDGGPAFPVTTIGETGMSLRDWFAGMALQALVAKAPLMDAEGEHGPKFDKQTLTQFRHDMAVSAYDYADAMLAERSKPTNT